MSGSFKEFYAKRRAQWKKDALAGGMPQQQIDEIEAALARDNAEWQAILRSGKHCGLPLVEKDDPWGRRWLVHVSCALGVNRCPDRFLTALERGYLTEIRASQEAGRLS